MQAKLTSIAFKTASAAVAAEAWLSNATIPQPVVGRVAITFSAVIQRAGAVYPNSDMRVCETAAAQMVLDRLQQFDRLLEENEALKAKLVNLETFMQASPKDEKALRAVHVAAQMLWEPIHAHLNPDASRLAETFTRILTSFGLSCEAESGEAPAVMEIEGEHHWVRFSDGTIFEVALDRSPFYDKSTLGGRVRLIHPLDEMNDQYRPANSPALAM